MRVIITGGTGLIGRHLSESLVRDQHEVIVLSRNPSKASNLPAGVRVERWDGQTAEGWSKLADGADAIVNLAGENIGEGLWTTERKRRIVESRLNAGRAVVEAVEAASSKPEVVVQASGVGYYGNRGDEELTEGSAPGDGFLARLAVEWEASTAAVEPLGVRRAIIRTGGVLAREGGALPKMILPFRLFIGGPLGSGKQWLPWIHIADEVGAIRFLLENASATGPFNLVAPQPLTNANFGRELARVIRRPYYMPAPAFAIRLLLGEMASVVLEGQRALPAKLLQAGYRFHFSDAASALRDLLSPGGAR
jgi:uncharacterized protein (TIGR01777 family)